MDIGRWKLKVGYISLLFLVQYFSGSCFECRGFVFPLRFDHQAKFMTDIRVLGGKILKYGKG